MNTSEWIQIALLIAIIVETIAVFMLRFTMKRTNGKVDVFNNNFQKVTTNIDFIKGEISKYSGLMDNVANGKIAINGKSPLGDLNFNIDLSIVFRFLI